MRRRLPIGALITIAVFIAAALAAAPLSPAGPARLPAQTNREAEQNVLRVAAGWSDWRIANLVDSRTGLLKDNVQSICRGRGVRFDAGRYRRFVCVLRAWLSARRQELYVTYWALPHSRFRVHWLASQRP